MYNFPRGEFADKIYAWRTAERYTPFCILQNVCTALHQIHVRQQVFEEL